MTLPLPFGAASAANGKHAARGGPTFAQARLTRWLLTSGVQRPEGAVAGAVDANGRADYVYPEITGYYLQWLAWRAAEDDDRPMLAARARNAQSWLRDWLAAVGPVPTRVHAKAGTQDWRNHAVFTFDLGMVLRGVGAVVDLGLVEPDEALIAGLCRTLCSMIAPDGQLDACRIHSAGLEIPNRWSTRRGAFLAKAAAGIEHAAHVLPGIPVALRTAATTTFDASLEALVDSPHVETHPYFYAIEGYLAWPAHRCFAKYLTQVGAGFDRVADEVVALGRVPEVSGEPGKARLDIAAQMLRVGVLLAHHRGSALPDAVARLLVATLETAITPDGALPFVAAVTPTVQLNAWATMFATQALTWATLAPAAMRHIALAPGIV
jgi:hypothetical protein